MWFRQILDFRPLGLRISNLQFSLFFYQNSSKIEIFFVKIQILWSRVNDLKFWFSLGLRISNLTNFTKFQISPKSQILPKSKILNITNFLWVLGCEETQIRDVHVPWQDLFVDFKSRVDLDLKINSTTFYFYYGFKNFLQNFDDESQFWRISEILISTSKFWKSLCNACAPILGQIFQNFDHRILVK